MAGGRAAWSLGSDATISYRPPCLAEFIRNRANHWSVARAGRRQRETLPVVRKEPWQTFPPREALRAIKSLRRKSKFSKRWIFRFSGDQTALISPHSVDEHGTTPGGL